MIKTVSFQDAIHSLTLPEFNKNLFASADWLNVLEKTSKDGEVINPENLIKKGIINMIKGKAPEVKILGTGKLTKKIVVENCKASKTAKEAIERAGGTIK